MNRPQFQEMLKGLRAGKAAALFVKDLSRIGRNYIEVGDLTDNILPMLNVRLVSVSEGIDTREGEDDLVPIRNLFNEWYSRDISKKIRMSYKVKGMSGIPVGNPPYGYLKDPENNKVWIVDREAAQVINRIDTLTLSGYGVQQIADILAADKVLTPTAHARKLGIIKPTNRGSSDPYAWHPASITRILNQPAYCGDVVNFKTYSPSYKVRARTPNDPENMAIFRNVHEPIRDRETYAKIQEMRGKVRKRKTRDDEHNMFSGLLFCADCGGVLNYHFNQTNHSIKYFNCSNYNKGKLKTCFSTHYIRVDFLEHIVLSEIRRLTRFACKYEDKFTEMVAEYSKAAVEKDKRIYENELKYLINRDKEIDKLFERIYEDNVSGKLTDHRFAKLSKQYEEEQVTIGDRIGQLKKAYDEIQNKVVRTDAFISAVRKYTRAKKLTPLMLGELIDHIDVYQAETVNGENSQKVIIHYNCIGAITIPEELPIPKPDIELNTRRGVFISYVPSSASV
jgi:hypothetical protein